MGKLFLGRYEVVRELGGGSMGEVHLCRDRLEDRLVALKEITGPCRELIRREFEILRSIDHPSVAKALDYSEDSSGNAFLTQEYIDGADLLEASNRSDLKQIARRAMDISLTLHFLHSRGIVHGDLKPQNIIVPPGEDSAPVLVDFGLAGPAESTDSIRGTPAYMAPELLHGGAPSPQSDIYSLGAVLYHCIAGEPPYSGNTAADMLHAVAHGQAAPLRERVPDLPSGVSDIIEGMLIRDPAMRCQSAGRSAKDFGAFVGESVSADQWRGGRWPLLGRESEIALLRGLLDKLRAGETTGSVLIHGPKGIGASRLLEAALDHARTAGVRVLSIPLASRSDPAKVLLELLPAKDNETVSHRPGSDVASVAVEEKAPLRLRRRVAEALAGAATSGGPMLVAFDDLEEATVSVLDLVRFLSLQFAEGYATQSPVMIMAAHSGPLVEALAEDVSAGWLDDMELGPLTSDAMAVAIEESWGTPASEKVLARLAELSGGNPLWLREILQTVTGEDRIDEARSPQSLTELLRGSVSALDTDTIRLLEAMSVFGEAASVDEIAKLADSDPEDIVEMPVKLVRRGLAKAEAGLFAPATPLLAASMVIDSAPSVLRDLHARAAEVLIDRPDAPPDRIAQHLIGAGEAEVAIPYVLRAGEELRLRGSHREAALLYESILEVAPYGEGKITLLEGLARSAAPAGMWRLALSALRWRLEATDDDPPNVRAGFHLEMAHCQQRIGEYERAERAIGRAQDELKGDTLSPEALKAKEISSLLDIARGRYEDAIATCREAVEELGSNHATGVASAPFRAAAGIALVNTTQYDEAKAQFDEAINVFRDAGDDAGLVMALSGLGMARQHVEDYDGALDAYQGALDAARSAGDVRAEATITMNIATVYHARGMWDEAKLQYNRALLLARQVGASADEVRILGNLGNMLLYFGDTDGALSLVERSLVGAKRSGLAAYRAYAHLLRGDILKLRGEVMGARKEYIRSRRLFEKLGNARESAQVDLRLGRLYLEMGEQSRARHTIMRAEQGSVELGHRAFQAEAALLDARCDLAWGRAEDAVDRTREAIELSDGEEKGFAWETHATLGAALLASGKKEAAEDELQAANDMAVKERNSLPVEYRDAFLSGPVWRELLGNLEIVKGREGGVPQERWKKLIEINRRLTTEHNLSRLLELIMDSVLELIEAERGFLILVEDGKMSVPVARNIDRESIRGAKMKISRSIAEEVARSGEPLITVDAQHDARFDRYASVHDLKLRSVLCIPLKMRDITIGTLYVDNRFREGAFKEEDRSVMEAFADQAAIAIDNARRNEELQTSHLKIKELAEQLERRVDKQSAQIEEMRIELARRTPDDAHRYPEIVGDSRAMREVYAVMDRVASSDVPVLIEGESGTGKELVARAVHFHGPRKDKRFLSENCSAIPESLLESELFGHEKGAFTGATERKIGLFEMADGGTLFLDEIGDMSPGMQAKLLRVLQDGEIRRVGGQRTFNVNVRVISATHQRLEQLVQKGLFREDLYWRLNVIKIGLPLLNQRREDIPLLVKHFSTILSEDMGRPVDVDSAAMRLLVAYDWPGNVRELENEMRKAAVLGDGLIRVADLSRRIIEAVQGPKTHIIADASGKLKSVVEQFEKEYLRQILDECGGNRAEAARRLGIGRRTLYDKLARYNLDEES